GVQGTESYDDVLAEAGAIHTATQAALTRLDELADTAPEDVVSRLRAAAEHRSHRGWERLGRAETEHGEPPSTMHRRLRLEMLAAERDTLVALRNEGRIDDEVLSRAVHDLDLEEALLNR
ncbi:MAG: Na+/H+ antiporter, partial [Pseudonocardiaceae bacterium]